MMNGFGAELHPPIDRSVGVIGLIGMILAAWSLLKETDNKIAIDRFTVAVVSQSHRFIHNDN